MSDPRADLVEAGNAIGDALSYLRERDVEQTYAAVLEARAALGRVLESLEEGWGTP